MGLEIKRFTPQERQKFKETRPLAEPKEWAIMDDDMVFGFYDICREAKKDLRELIRGDKMRELFAIWRTQIATEFGVSEGEVDEAVKS